jgi:hypothetical protein
LDGEHHAPARELVRVLLNLYGEALGRLMEIVAADKKMLAQIARDERLRGVLLLHGLHPEPAETRVRDALAEFRGIEIKALAITADALQLRVSCDDLVAAGRLRPRIEQAIADAAPELKSVSIEGLPAARRSISIPVVVVAG